MERGARQLASGSPSDNESLHRRNGDELCRIVISVRALLSGGERDGVFSFDYLFGFLM